MGREFLRLLLSSSAFFFPRRQRTPTFHAAGTHFTDQHELKTCSSAGISDGHWYGIWCMGLGHDEMFSLKMTSAISSSVKALTSKPVERVDE